jgi:asparagine synthase (glutamine-hydrolysing)
MCGIAAVHVPDESGERWLTRLLRPIEHRGLPPTLYEAARAGSTGWWLGANRLPIVAEPNGRQPVASPGGRFVVVFNGEVFNYRELARELPGPLPTGAERQPDTLVLAAALEAWGVRATLERLVWEGAFVAVEQSSGRLWAVRDHLGIKPLYRAEFAEGVAFASEIKALVDLPGCAQVHPVPPAMVEEFDPTGAPLGSRRWWETHGRAVRPLSETAAKQELLDALRTAVHLRVPRGPFAIALSGGLDSAAVLRFAVEVGEPRAYVLHRPGSPDLRFARSLCERLGVALTEVAGFDPARLRSELPNVIAALETWEWQVVNHAAPMLALTAAIRADGHRVVLSGEGADELFLGYSRARSPLTPKQEQLDRITALHRTNCRRLDRMGMRDQLEFRVPFLDRSVTELALSMPSELLVRDGVPKWILREALRGILPAEIVDRPKLAMARGAGYQYSAGTTPTVFGELPIPETALDPAVAGLPRYPAEQVFLQQFVQCGYVRAGYLLSRSA